MYLDAKLEAMHGGIPEVTQVDKLIAMLETTDIPFGVTENHGRPQVWYPDKEHPVCDAICNWVSYGHQTGLIEIMGLTHNDDSVEGYLNADEVFARIKEHWEETGEKI